MEELPTTRNIENDIFGLVRQVELYLFQYGLKNTISLLRFIIMG